MVIRCTTMRLAPQIFFRSQRHNTHSLQHHRHVTQSLQALLVSHLRLHQCRLTRQELHCRELQFEQGKPVHCRADHQSRDVRRQTKANLAILTHFLLFESHRLHHHQRPLSSLMEQDLKIDSRLVDLLLFLRALQYQTSIPLQQAKCLHKRLPNSRT
jgi:hypothetical protein